MPRPHEFDDTDFMLPHFVCWDERKNPPKRLAKNEARFDNKDDAIEFFNLKLKNRKLACLWYGILGMDEKIGFDWMHVQSRTHSAKANRGIAWSNWTEVSFTPVVPTPKV
jgi:hypothetical protein